MLKILTFTFPIFLMIGFGYFFVRTNLISSSTLPALSSYVIKLALPALLFQSMASRSLEDSLNVQYIQAYLLGSVILLILVFLFSYIIRGTNSWEAAFQGLGATLSNSAFMGLAVSSSLFGTDAMIAVVLSMLVDLLVLIPLGLLLAEKYGTHDYTNKPTTSLLSRTLVNPLIISVIAGLLVSWQNIQFPVVFEQAVGMIGHSAPALALFVIGGSLVGCSLKGRITDISQMTLLKLIAHPVAVASVVCLLPDFDPTMQTIAILMAAMPMASVLSLLGERYGQSEICSPSIIIATGLSFLSINLVLWLLAQTGRLPLM